MIQTKCVCRIRNYRRKVISQGSSESDIVWRREKIFGKLIEIIFRQLLWKSQRQLLPFCFFHECPNDTEMINYRSNWNISKSSTQKKPSATLLTNVSLETDFYRAWWLLLIHWWPRFEHTIADQFFMSRREKNLLLVEVKRLEQSRWQIDKKDCLE